MTGFDPYQSRIRQVSQELAEANFDPLQDENPEDHELHAAGEVCARCDQAIKPGQDVRRNAKHEWVHETCPVPAAES